MYVPLDLGDVDLQIVCGMYFGLLLRMCREEGILWGKLGVHVISEMSWKGHSVFSS